MTQLYRIDFCGCAYVAADSPREADKIMEAQWPDGPVGIEWPDAEPVTAVADIDPEWVTSLPFAARGTPERSCKEWVEKEPAK